MERGNDKAAVRPATPAELRRMKPIMRLVSRVHTGVLRLSGGRLGSRFRGGAPVGLLSTIGRKSGQRRTLPLLYLKDGERIVLVASQGGAVRHPIWYLNLDANPDVEFQIGAELRKYRARRSSAEEKAAFWPRLCAMYPDYDSYQKRTDRDIPVVILEPR